MLMCFLFSSCSREEKLFSKNISPSGRYSLYIYAYIPSGIINDIGIAKLIDNKNHEIIHQKKMNDIRYDFSVIMWCENEIILDHFATWHLPDGGAGKGTMHVK